MGVAEGGAMERNDEPPTGLLDPDDHIPVREDDELPNWLTYEKSVRRKILKIILVLMELRAIIPW